MYDKKNNRFHSNAILAVWLLLLGYAVTLPVRAADVLIPTSQILESAKGKYYLISIGINSYRDAFWPSLKWPASDATRIADQLGKDTPSRIEKTLLINEYATYDSVVNSLNKTATEANENDTVVLYVSGHGTLVQNASGELERVIVLHDSNQSRLLSSGLSHSTLNGWMERLRSKKKMMVFATCHSGEGKSRLPENIQTLIQSNKGVLPPLSEVSEGALVLAAAAKGESARENDELQGDIYTHYLLQALTVYDRNRDGMVSALEAHDYARERTWAFSKGRQRPTANVQQIGDADIPLYGTKIASGLPVLEAYNETLAGFFVQVDDGIKGRLPLAFPLDPAGSVISFYSPGGERPLKRYKVSANDGEAISLDAVMNDRPIVIGLRLNRFNWSDSNWSKLTGSSSVSAREFNIALQWRQFAFGVLTNQSIEGSNMIRDPIESSTVLKYTLLTVDYLHKQGQFTFTGRLEYGREQLDIKLNDTSVDETLEFSDKSTSKGLSLSVAYNFEADLSLTLETGIRDSDWQFDTIGDLSGKRRTVSFGVDYRFGTKARTLW